MKEPGYGVSNVVRNQRRMEDERPDLNRRAVSANDGGQSTHAYLGTLMFFLSFGRIG